MDFINSQRRRHKLIMAWQSYLKDIDVYVGAADTGAHSQTGHPVAVVQMGFGVRPGGFGGGGGRGGPPGAPGAAGGGRDSAAAPPPPPLNPQPITTQIAGNLFNDDLVLSVAHAYQREHNWLTERPKLG
jgi:hypothetical protein